MKKKVILSILMISLLLVGCGSNSDKMVSKMTKFSKDISIDDDSTLNWKKYCLKSGDIACIDSSYKKDSSTRYTVKDFDNNGIPEIICTRLDSKGNMESEIVSFYDFEYENNKDNKNYGKDTEFDITKPSHNVIASGSTCYFSDGGYFTIDFDGDDLSSFYKITYYGEYPILDNGERVKSQFIKDKKTGLWSVTDMYGNIVSDLDFDDFIATGLYDDFEDKCASYALVDYIEDSYSDSGLDCELFNYRDAEIFNVIIQTYSVADAELTPHHMYSSYNAVYNALLNGTW